MKKIVKILTVILILTSTSCNKDNDEGTTPVDYEYFPLEIGSWIIYEIEDIYYDNSDTLTYEKYFCKEIIESIYNDNEGIIAYRIERYKKENDSLSWEIKDIWSASIIPGAAHKVEENVRYLKLTFPVKVGKKWNGNAFNNLGEMMYEITAADQPGTVNGLSFDSTLTVLQADELSLIHKKFYTEKYAKHIGLIYKKIIDIYSGNYTGGNDSIMDRIEKGTVFTQKIIDYGKQIK